MKQLALMTVTVAGCAAAIATTPSSIQVAWRLPDGVRTPSTGATEQISLIVENFKPGFGWTPVYGTTTSRKLMQDVVSGTRRVYIEGQIPQGPWRIRIDTLVFSHTFLDFYYGNSFSQEFPDDPNNPDDFPSLINVGYLKKIDLRR